MAAVQPAADHRASAMLADLLRGANASASTAAANTATRCPLFPTESEDFYCLSCHTRCSGLALLVGPHTNHDHLPLKDALLYMPAALLRETHEVVKEAEEAFAKPWRGQEQQREENLHYLLQQRRSKLAAVAQLMDDVRTVDAQLARVTEAKAVDLSNWRYQQRALRRKIERLQSGADTLSSALRGPTGAVATSHGSGQEQAANGSGGGDPSWRHRQAVAQEELGQVRHLLRRQLAHLAEDEEAVAHHLATWRRLLDAVPGGPDTTETHAPVAQTDAPSRTWWREAGKPAVACSDGGTPGRSATAVQRQQQQQLSPFRRPTPTTPEPTTILGHAPDVTSPHPSDAEVVLLQHALLNIHDGLRRRLLRAAAASLSSSSAASSESRTAAAGETPLMGLHSLPAETPLRCATESVPRREGRATPAAVGAAEEPSPPPRPSARTAAAAAAAAATAVVGMVDTPVSAGVGGERGEEDGQGRRVRWQSLQAQDRALKASLDQLLEDATGGPGLHGVRTAVGAAARGTSSSSSSSIAREVCAGEYGTVSAMSGPLSSITALQHYAMDD